MRHTIMKVAGHEFQVTSFARVYEDGKRGFSVHIVEGSHMYHCDVAGNPEGTGANQSRSRAEQIALEKLLDLLERANN